MSFSMGWKETPEPFSLLFSSQVYEYTYHQKKAGTPGCIRCTRGLLAEGERAEVEFHNKKKCTPRKKFYKRSTKEVISSTPQQSSGGGLFHSMMRFTHCEYSMPWHYALH